MDSASGWLTVADSFRQSRGQTFSVIIEATDRGVPPRASSVTALIRVTEVNLHDPVFRGGSSSFRVSVAEDIQPDTVIATLSATDNDRGQNGRVSYFISQGNADGLFSIDESGGYLRVERPLDYEMTQVHILEVTARDRGMLPRETSRRFEVTVTDVNDNAPVFSKDVWVAYVQENVASGTSILELSASDPDSSTNGVIQYGLLDRGQRKFNLDRETGVLSTRGQLDYESDQAYRIRVKVMNPGTQLSSTATVDVHVTGVNEFIPEFSQNEYSFVVSESASAGYAVGMVSASDLDQGDDAVVYYYFIGDSNLKGFSIHPTTGVISIFNSIDRESASEIILDVMAKNRGPVRGNDTSKCQVRVMVRDANDPPQFTQSVYEAAVGEDSISGSSVIQVTAVDSDIQVDDARFVYRILGGNEDRLFQIDERSGLIQTQGFLDREGVALHSLSIGAVDSGTPPKTGKPS